MASIAAPLAKAPVAPSRLIVIVATRSVAETSSSCRNCFLQKRGPFRASFLFYSTLFPDRRQVKKLARQFWSRALVFVFEEDIGLLPVLAAYALKPFR